MATIEDIMSMGPTEIHPLPWVLDGPYFRQGTVEKYWNIIDDNDMAVFEIGDEAMGQFIVDQINREVA